MSAVIRSVKLLKEPVTLPRNGVGRPGVVEAFSAARAPRGLEHRARAPLPAPAAQPPIVEISYEEYKQRFAAELDAERHEAREKGLREGREAGLAKALSEHASQLQALATVVRSARTRLEEGIGDLADVGAEIAFEAACKVLGQALADRDGIIAAVREAVRRARDRSRLIVRVSPADFDLIRDNRVKILEGLDAGRVEIAADDRVELGGCLLETPSGTLDSRLEVQVANLRRTLLEARSRQINEDGTL
jgi:flagellar assembly protein FliH